LIRSSGDQLRNRARDLDRNNDYVISAVNKFTTKVLGEKCPVFQSRIKKQRSSTGSAELNTPLNLRIEEEFRKWQDDPASCSSNKSWNFNRILDLCVRTLMVDGEVFIRRIQMARGRSPIKFCLELIEADNLADTYHGDRSGNPIVNGIEYDEWGAPVAYWFYPYNPNDFLYGKNQNYSKGFAEPIRYPADEILHLYSPRRVTQGRGVSFFAATISRLRDLVGYEQAVLVGARMRAAVMGFITSVEGEDAWGHENPNNPNAPRQYSFEPGTIQKLSEGENFELSSPQDPGPNLEGFARHQLRAFAANLGIAFSSLSGDYSQANYSSERANQIDERRGIRRVQELITSSLLTPVTDWWLDAAVLSGAIAVPEKLSVRDYYCCYTWRLGGFEWVDPYKDAQAFELQLKNGMTTLQRVLAEKNIDLNTLIEERKYEQALLEDAGIRLAYLAELGGGEDAPEEDSNAEIKEGLTQIRSILNTQSTQIQQLGTVLLEASRSIAMANTAIAEVRGAADRSITVINQSPKLIEPSESVDDMVPIRYTVGRKAKNCKKGKPCGGSCISNAKSCRIGLSADQKALAINAKKAIKSGGGDEGEKKDFGNKIKSPSVSPDGDYIEKDDYSVDYYRIDSSDGNFYTSATLSFDDGDDFEVTTNVDRLSKYTDSDSKEVEGYKKIEKTIPDALDYDFTVNESYDTVDTSPSKASKIASVASEDFRRIFQQLKEGQVLVNSPYDDDGKGNKRARIYERLGFSAPIEIEGKLFQFSVKNGDSLAPYTIEIQQ
jgi:lambda family phage portal protein